MEIEIEGITKHIMTLDEEVRLYAPQNIILRVRIDL